MRGQGPRWGGQEVRKVALHEDPTREVGDQRQGTREDAFGCEVRDASKDSVARQRVKLAQEQRADLARKRVVAHKATMMRRWIEKLKGRHSADSEYFISIAISAPW